MATSLRRRRCGIRGGQRLEHGQRLPLRRERLVAALQGQQDVGVVALGDRQVAAEHGVGRIRGGGVAEDLGRAAELGERAGGIADVRLVRIAERVAELLIGDAELPHVVEIVGGCGGEPPP